MKNGKIEKTYYVYLFPLILAIVVLPLAVRLVSYYNPSAAYAWNAGTEYAGDVFLLVKQHLLYGIMGIIAFFLLCFVLLRRKIFGGTKFMLCLAAYLVFAIVSAVLAHNSYLAWHGASDRFESVFVLAGYLLLFYYTYIVILGEKTHAEAARQLLIRAMGLLSFLLGIVGFFQMLGYDIYQNAAVAKLCGIEDAEFVDSVRIYLSLYHSDYVGVMMVLLLPMDAAGFLTEKKRGWKLFFLADLFFVLLCLFASQSRSGVLCLALCILLFYPLWLFRKTQKKKILAGTLLCLLVAAGLFFAVDQIQGHRLTQRFFHTETTTRKDALFIETGKNGVLFRRKETQSYQAKFVGKGADQTLVLQDETGQPVVSGTGELSDIAIQKQRLSYEGKELYGYTFSYRKQNCFLTNQWGNSGYYYLNALGKLDQCVLSEDAFPVSWYGFASYRGFVWSKTIPLLKQTIWYGVGPDNFEGLFPNDDYTSRYYARLQQVIYNKPHSWYLQMAVETGVLSAVCMVLFLGGVILQGVRLLWRKRAEAESAGWCRLAAGVFACTAYCMMGLCNDSMLVTAPVFWVILGFTGALSQEMLASREKIR